MDLRMQRRREKEEKREEQRKGVGIEGMTSEMPFRGACVCVNDVSVCLCVCVCFLSLCVSACSLTASSQPKIADQPAMADT